MKMTSQLVTLVLAVFFCSAAVVYSQTSTPVAPTNEPISTSISTPRPAVATTPPPVDNGTPAPSANVTDAPAPVVTDAPMTSAKHDDDGMKGDGDMDGQKGHDDDEEDGGGLRRGDLALAILATILVIAVICTFIGLCYWKYKGTSYVTVTADTTYRQ